MHEHLQFVGEKVHPQTAAGAWTHELLDLDDPEVVEYRLFILDALERYEVQRQELRDTLHELRRLKTAEAAPDIDEAIATLKADLATIERHLRRLEGR
jgi:hypothetical protein